MRKRFPGKLIYARFDEMMLPIIKIQHLDGRILECFKYSLENDLKTFNTGSHKINGDDVFVNIVSYNTVDKEERFWEAHKKYIDVHLMLDGTEK